MPYSPVQPRKSLFDLMPDPVALSKRLPQAAPAPKPLSRFQQLKDQFFGGMPAGGEGLLTAEDLKGAEKSGMLNLGLSLLADSGPKLAKDYVSPMASIGKALSAAKGGYSDALNSAAQLRAGGLDMKAKQLGIEEKQQGVDSTKKITAGREAIAKKYGTPDPKDPAGFAKWIDATIGEFVSIGDTDTVRSLSEIRKTLKPTDPGFHAVNTGGTTKIFDDRGNLIREEKNSPAPWDPQRGAESRAITEANNIARREDRFVSGYTNDIKSDREAHALIGNSLSNAPLAKAGDGAAQIQIVNAFVKSLDPGTANREGEVELARSAAPVMAQAKAFLQKYSTNKSALVPPELIAQMESLLQKRLQGMEGYMDQRRKYWISRAERAKIPDADLLYDEPPRFKVPGPETTRPPLGSLR